MAQEIPYALGKIGLPAVEPLLTALTDSDGVVRKLAAETLGRIGDARAVAPLIPALNDDDEHVRRCAVEALGNLGDASAVDPLVALLTGYDIDFRLRAVIALGKIGDLGAAEALIAVLADSDGNVRRRAVDSLEKIGWQPTQDTTGAYYWAARQDWQACRQVGAAALEPLLAALRVDDWVVRQHAAELLGEIGDSRAVETLIAALDDKIAHVRRNAARALVSLYQAGKLDPQSHQQLLAQREMMSQPHVDNQHECGGHTDRGIGIDFPL
jgi:HEAT repeat protein